MSGCRKKTQLIRKGRTFSIVSSNGGSRWKGKSESQLKVYKNAVKNTKAVALGKAMATISLTKASKWDRKGKFSKNKKDSNQSGQMCVSEN